MNTKNSIQTIKQKTMNVICYKRVSTDDQADRGFSLQHQEDMLRKWCEINNHNIIEIYTEDFSGKTFNRPEWKKLMAFIKKNKKIVDLILCNRWDRFSRNQYDALTTIKELHKLGVTVNTVEQPLDLTNPDNKVLLSLYLTIPEVENDKNSIRTTEGSRRARLEGYWTGSRPRGYINHRDQDKKSTLLPSKDAPLIVSVFEKMASESFSAEEVRRWLNKKGVKISKQTFLDLIRNPVYIGKIRVKAWKKEPSQLATGIHPPLISEELFYKANDVLDGRKRNMKFHHDKIDLYPLKGFLKCPEHGGSLTAYGTMSRNKQLHHYYLCVKDRCKQRHRIKDAHDSIENVLSQISISAQILMLYKKILEKIFDRDDLLKRDEIQKLKKEIERNEQRKSNLQDRFLDSEITPQDYHDMKGKVEKEVILLKTRLSDITEKGSPYKTYISKTVPMLEDLVSYYRKADGLTKKKILSCIFSEKVVLENGRVATIPFTTPVQVLFNASKVLEESKNKKEVENDLLSCMAPPAGEVSYFILSHLQGKCNTLLN
jgi:site-specific DNA recombinase